MAIEKQLYERQMELIFRMLLENKTNEQMASELKISIRSVQNYKRRLEQRYMTYQREKTDSTLFLEVNLLKNRLLKLYRCLESKTTDPETGASDSARCADVAASIAISVIKLEVEGIKAIKEVGLSTTKNLASKRNDNSVLNNNLGNNDYEEDRPNNSHYNNNNHQLEENQEENNNSKF